ncbi:MAG: hypothetical protein NW224_28035 [Leptolyngbyaceae cyanobacterium bins.302]|nr:hypothetical protein [Leptolyngbyaceae cyanobacterium bins.302]
MNSNLIQLTIRFVDPALTTEERDREVRNLLTQLKGVDEIERVQRVVDLNPPKNHMGTGFLVDLLCAEVSWKNFMVVMGFLGDRLGNKPIELEIEVQNIKLKVSASSRAEFEFVMKQAYAFISTQVNRDENNEEGCTTDRSEPIRF